MSVYIKITDRNWIIEQLARSLAERLDYVSYGTASPPVMADACYYMTYSAHVAGEFAGPTVAFFSHLEEDETAASRFFDIAGAVDHRVCMADRYTRMLTERGFPETTTLVPGVDLEQFEARVKIGVVGRTYHTGRKGERLVEAVMDVPGIDWSFTGSGWPLPGLNIAQEGMADFYRSLDYVLIPARYEGGPMPLIEALACGTPVIAPDVGFVEKFPHLPYDTDDADDLRRVLLECVAQKQTLRNAVVGCTWDAWAEGHDQLFTKLGLASSQDTQARLPVPVNLILHGTERTTLGGPSLRVPATARALRANGLDACNLFKDARFREPVPGIAHVHNVWSPASALDALAHVKRSADRVVFSPIYMDLSELDGYQSKLPAIAGACSGFGALRRSLDDLACSEWLGPLARERDREPVGGYHARVDTMLSMADRVVCLSRTERALLERYGLDRDRCSVVLNPVDANRFNDSSGSASFADTHGVAGYVLCVGRIEPRKNQLLLAAACRELGVPLVLVGHVGDPSYHAEVLRWGGEGLKHIERLDPSDPLLAAAFREAGCFALPSFSEGAPLAALEAASCGQSLLLSDRSSEQEYFGEHAAYCNPADLDSMIGGIDKALKRERAADELQRLVAEEFSWDRHTEGLEAVYRAALDEPPTDMSNDEASARVDLAPPVSTHGDASLARVAASTVLLDMTTTLHNHSGRITGISRVEQQIAAHMGAEGSTRNVAWVDPTVGFVALGCDASCAHSVAKCRHDLHVAPNAVGAELVPTAADHLIVSGSAWMQNTEYALAVVRLVRKHGLRLTLVVHDLIPVLFPHWYAVGYSEVFAGNLRILCDCASAFVCDSRSTRADLMDFVGESGDRFRVFELGSSLRRPDAATTDTAPPGPGRPYVLAVGAVHPRKNYQHLYNVWTELARHGEIDLPDLVIAGGYGWQSDGLKEAIERNPILRDRWHVLSDIDDDQLSLLYENCLFTVFPSLYEGWGLPVAESLAYAKVCLCSDRSSIPEIADASLLVALDPLDSRAWETKIVAYVKNRDQRTRHEELIRNSYRPLPWSESVSRLATLLPMTPYVARDDAVFGGELLDMGSPSGSRLLGNGWSGGERDGVFTDGRDAFLHWTFRSTGAVEQGIWIECSAYEPRSGFVQRVDALQGDRVIDAWTISNSSRQLRFLPAAIGHGSLALRIHDPVAPHVVDGGGDLRRLGIKLHRVWFGSGQSSALELFGYDDILPFDAFRTADGTARNGTDGVLGCTALGHAGLVIEAVASARDTRLMLEVRAESVSGKPVQATFEVNGIAVSDVELDSGQIGRPVIEVPASVLRLRHPVHLRASLCNEAVQGRDADRSVPRLGLLSLSSLDATPATPYPHAGMPTELSERFIGKVSGAELAPSLGRGWYPIEPDGVWSFSQSPMIRLRTRARGDQFLELVASWLGDTCPIESVHIGGTSVAWRLLKDGAACGRVQIVHAGRSGDLELGLRKPVSPNDLGLSRDSRPLGLQMHSLLVTDIPDAGQFRPETGWHAREPDGIWSGERSAQLVWCLPRPGHGLGLGLGNTGRMTPDIVSVQVTTLGEGDQDLEIRIDGAIVASARVPPGRVETIRFELPDAPETDWLLDGDPVRVPMTTRIEFLSGPLRRPVDLGMSEDSRKLGVCLHALDVVTDEISPLLAGDPPVSETSCELPPCNVGEASRHAHQDVAEVLLVSGGPGGPIPQECPVR